MSTGKTDTWRRRLRWATYGSWALTAASAGTRASTAYAARVRGPGHQRRTARSFTVREASARLSTTAAVIATALARRGAWRAGGAWPPMLATIRNGSTSAG